MLKHDTQNYLRQFTKTLNTCFQWNTTHRDFLMYDYFWLELVNVCAKYGILSDKYIRSIG